jgi:hypothetical protein
MCNRVHARLVHVISRLPTSLNPEHVPPPTIPTNKQTMPSSSLKISSISLKTFNATLARYPSIAPAKLKDLDTLRYVTVPAKLAKRKKEVGEGEVCLEREELEGLVEWKLYV